MSSDQTTSKQIERSNGFRFVFANNFGIKVSDNDILLMLNNEQVVEEAKILMQEIGDVFTPRSMKILAHLLTEAVRQYETAIEPISVPEGKLEAISARFKVNAGNS